LASNFNPDPDAPPETGAGGGDDQRSPAVARFESCRWRQPAEDGEPAFCTHQEVKPYAGTAGFDPGAWCPDCEHYKLRRTPRKPRRDDDADQF
jgi:hypothetical protein